jgi:cobaltochelatase CobN
MHLLAAQPGIISDGGAAVDLAQSAGEIVVLSAADSEISCLAAAQAALVADGAAPSLRLANLLTLSHHYSVDLYCDQVLARARLVIVRLLGGKAYWPYGIERLAALAKDGGPLLALLPGDDQPDAELFALSTVTPQSLHRLWRYLAEGGARNAAEFLRHAASLIGRQAEWREPQPLLKAGYYWPGADNAALEDVRAHWRHGAPAAAILFYRALVHGANTAPVDALIDALTARGQNPLPLYVAGLKDFESRALIEQAFAAAPPDIVLNATGFAAGTPLPGDAPVLQVIFSGGSRAAWEAGTRGLDARDIAMNVALPEMDGRIIGRGVSFKATRVRDPITEADLTRYEPVPDRVAFTADLARNWSKLRRAAPAERRVVIVLANYPNRDGRIGNGVGLDTPASVIGVLQGLKAAGYRVENIPEDGDALIARLLEGPTNAAPGRMAEETFPRSDYGAVFATLPRAVQEKVEARWGAPEADPFFRRGELDCGAFAIAALRCGNVVVALQPSRGYGLAPAASYHDPDLPPPHAYLAFYAWIADGVRAHAVVHMGKHGNLEWLPGKAVALGAECFPEAALGPLPNLYPFIVNDPGEGTQAKRRAQAVIVDHLTPPLTRAETHGRLAELERLVDEYYAASGNDPRRLPLLRREILELVHAEGLDRDCGIGAGETEGAALQKLDAYLCELKEMQIRGGLHVFGRSPEGMALADLLVALTRLPRGEAPGDQSILRALAADLSLGFDPLDAAAAQDWHGPRPACLGGPEGWRSEGDAIERLEHLARALVARERAPDQAWTRTRAVLQWIDETLRPRVAACGRDEIAGLLRGLDGRFVQPGPAGAPSRGRPEVLPTGRNFHSLDSRAVPTQAAWQLGWKSASLLIERHAQEQGDYPRRIALSAWGTANMRTGGDDVAQALALMGVRPSWDARTGRVTGFEVLPAGVLGRPRVDVTLRVSGFFRDAFPALVDLVDSAARAVAALDEPADVNPLADAVRRDRAALEAQGASSGEAARRAGYRVFGSKPGAYGAGLQALIDEGHWEDEGDLAAAYLAWGGYAYGAGAEGAGERELFRARLAAIEAVVQNQDNREHDILDSDDYYQFEGGLAATVRHVKGAQPMVYHNDHSRPEAPRIRTLAEEVGRVVRARAANPKWIAAIMRHGYKGGFELAATVDYLFAFAATAGSVEPHHFEAVYSAYLEAPEVRAFLEKHNPAALAEIKARFKEAIERRLWQPRRNSILQDLTR